MGADGAISAVCKKRYTEKSRRKAVQIFAENVSVLSVSDWFECLLNCNHRFRDRIRWLCAGTLLEEEYDELYKLVFRELSEKSPNDDISFYTTFFLKPLYHPDEDDGRKIIRFLEIESNIGYMWIKKLPCMDSEKVREKYENCKELAAKKRLFNYLSHCLEDKHRLDFVLGELEVFFQEDYDLLPGASYELIRYIDLDIIEIFNGNRQVPENLALSLMHHLSWRKDSIMKFSEDEIELIYNYLIVTPKKIHPERFVTFGYDIMAWNKYGLKFLFFNQHTLESMIESGYTYSINLWSESPWNYVEQVLDPFYEVAVGSMDHDSIAKLLSSLNEKYSSNWKYPFENMMLTLLLWIGDDAYSSVVTEMLNSEDSRHWRDVEKIIELKRIRNQMTKLLDNLST